MKISTTHQHTKLRPRNLQPAQGDGPSWISALKYKLHAIRQRTLATVRQGDYGTQGRLDEMTLLWTDERLRWELLAAGSQDAVDRIVVMGIGLLTNSSPESVTAV